MEPCSTVWSIRKRLYYPIIQGVGKTGALIFFGKYPDGKPQNVLCQCDWGKIKNHPPE
jgi:hypothetical protein